MRTIRVRTALLLGLAGLLLLAAAATPPAGGPSPLDRFTPEQKQKLLAGESILMTVKSNVGGKITGHGQAAIIVNAPVADCFRIFCDFNQHAKFFPRKTKSHVIKSTPTTATVEKEFNFYGFTVKYVMLYTIDAKNHRVNYQIDPAYPHDIEDTAGFFQFEKLDDQRTLFSFAVTKLETSIAVPGFIQDYLTSRDLPALATNVKKRIESKGTWVKSE